MRDVFARQLVVGRGLKYLGCGGLKEGGKTFERRNEVIRVMKMKYSEGLFL